MAPDAASRNPSTNHGKKTADAVSQSFYVAQQVYKDIRAGEMEMLSVACQWFHCQTDTSWCQL
jgi:hypothetical protein